MAGSFNVQPALGRKQVRRTAHYVDRQCRRMVIGLETAFCLEGIFVFSSLHVLWRLLVLYVKARMPLFLLYYNVYPRHILNSAYTPSTVTHF